MRRSLGAASCAALIAGCGGASLDQHPCSGLRTAPYSGHFLVLFGALNRLTKKEACAQVGAPRSVRRVSGGRELWSYGRGAITLTFKDGHVVAAGGKAAIGG